MKRLFLLFCALSICGCSLDYKLTLIPEQEGFIGNGFATSESKSVSISFKDKVYKGKYVYANEGRKKYGNQEEISTVKSHILESANGRFHATSNDGDSIRCEFLYSEGFGWGKCINSKGVQYDLLIHS